MLLRMSESGSDRSSVEGRGRLAAESVTARAKPTEKIVVVDSADPEPQAHASRPLFSKAKAGASTQLSSPRYRLNV